MEVERMKYFNTEGLCRPEKHYLGEQFIIETKIWHGNEYNERGEKQLAEYLDYYHKERGYLLRSCRKLTAQSKLSEKLEKSRFLHFKFEQ